jgi:hypothetical protein
MSKALQLLGIGVCLVCNVHALDFGGANDITAVSGRTSGDYVRTRLPNGSFAPESYAFGMGGAWSGAMKDASIDKLSFLDIAHMVAGPLASQSYTPSRDPENTKLLILVYWGTTHAPGRASDSNGYVNLQAANGRFEAVNTQAAQMTSMSKNPLITPKSAMIAAADSELTTAMAMVAAENRMRDQDDLLNVKMLGYDSWWESSQGEHSGTALGTQRRDLLSEIEEDRYFVVVMAYDFHLLWKEKKHKLLWETRFSIRQLHHDFDKDLPVMAKYASAYFGQDSHGLVHEAIPIGKVDIGNVRSLGEVPDGSGSAKAEPPGKP